MQSPPCPPVFWSRPTRGGHGSGPVDLSSFFSRRSADGRSMWTDVRISGRSRSRVVFDRTTVRATNRYSQSRMKHQTGNERGPQKPRPPGRAIPDRWPVVTFRSTPDRTHARLCLHVHRRQGCRQGDRREDGAPRQRRHPRGSIR